MIGDIDARQIWGQVWVSMHMAPAHPRTTTPPPRHRSRALGQPDPIPTIRSWLGGRIPDPHHTLTTQRTHTS